MKSNFDLELIKTDVEVKNKNDLLQKMVFDLFRNDYIKDPRGFLEAIITKEELHTTGIGYGIAFPHSIHNTVIKQIVVIYTLKEAIEYDALDFQPVNLVFLIASPVETNQKYLEILRFLSSILREKKNRQIILNTHDRIKLYQFLQGFVQ